MLAHNSKINDAEIAFELYSRSSVTVAKLIRQFLRPEWLHDEKLAKSQRICSVCLWYIHSITIYLGELFIQQRNVALMRRDGKAVDII